jgi:rhamnosyltransferase subunit B
LHFLLSTFGSSGDVFPMLGLALELRGRGHEVTFSTNVHYQGLAGKYGIPFEPLGTEEQFQACINHPDLGHPTRSFPHLFRVLSTVLRRQYEIHAQLAARGELVAIANCFALGALMAQDKLGVPVITVNLQPSVMWSDLDPPELAGVFGPRWLKRFMYRIGVRFFIDPVILPFLNPWRKELGLAPLANVPRWWNSSYGVLCMFPDWYAAPQKDWPSPCMQTDFPLWNHQTSERLPDEVERFLSAGDAPLVFTPGSTNVHGQAFFVAAVEACRALERRGILLTEFPAQLPRDLPPTVAHFSYIPLDLVLPRSAAFAHHGGIGSASQAMLAGIPQVMMPLAHDQFDNVARVRRLNVGDGLPAAQFTGPKLTALLARLLGSPEVSAACRQAAARLKSRDGLRRSADAIEARVAGRGLLQPLSGA